MPLCGSVINQYQKLVRCLLQQRQQVLFKYFIIHYIRAPTISFSTGELSIWRSEKFLKKRARWLQPWQVLQLGSGEAKKKLKKNKQATTKNQTKQNNKLKTPSKQPNKNLKKVTCSGIWCLNPQARMNKANFENTATQTFSIWLESRM